MYEYRATDHPNNNENEDMEALWDAKGHPVIGFTDVDEYYSPNADNKKLLAAAPEMKKLLKGLLAWIDKHIDEPTMDSTVLGTNLVLKAEMLLRDLQ